MNRVIRRLGWTLFVCATNTHVALAVEAVVVDTTTLPSLGNELRAENPYRGNRYAVEVGQVAFAKTCAHCHILATAGGVGPDLRLVGGYCRRIGEADLAAKCMQDADAYFLKSALNGKVVVGVSHMPAWSGVLTQEAIWAIRTYVESQAVLKKTSP